MQDYVNPFDEFDLDGKPQRHEQHDKLSELEKRRNQLTASIELLKAKRRTKAAKEKRSHETRLKCIVGGWVLKNDIPIVEKILDSETLSENDRQLLVNWYNDNGGFYINF